MHCWVGKQYSDCFEKTVKTFWWQDLTFGDFKEWSCHKTLYEKSNVYRHLRSVRRKSWKAGPIHRTSPAQKVVIVYSFFFISENCGGRLFGYSMVKTCHLAEAVLGNTTEDSRKTVYCLLDLIRCVHKGGWQFGSLQEESLVFYFFYYLFVFPDLPYYCVCLFLKVNILIRIRTITLSVCF